MTSWTAALQATTLCLALLWLLLSLLRPQKPTLVVVWAVFCASIAMLMAKQLAGAQATPWHYLIGLGACATCNGFWLVARALFREGRPFGPVHLFYAGSIGVLIVASQALGLFGDGLGWIGPRWQLPLAAALNQSLDLLSSTALVLAFWEGVRGWSRQSGAERRVRRVFLASYGGCVAVSSLAPALAAGAGASRDVEALAAALAALSILLVAQGLIHWRLRHPLGVTRASDADAGVAGAIAAPSSEATIAPASPRVASEAERHEDRLLASRLEQRMRDQRPYLGADLKLIHLAQALDVCEYRVSRAIHALGHRNSAHYINAYRVRHACRLLSDPSCAEWSTLVIGLESGFGSLGAFHRAFKANIGCTPGEYRSAAGMPAAVVAPDTA